MVGPLNTTITVINRSGKVVSSTKHLVSVFKEAKAAYVSRKAEIQATRDSNLKDKRTRHSLQQLSLSDEHLPRGSGSGAPRRSKTTSKRHHNHQHDNPRGYLGRGITDSAYTNDVQYCHPNSQDAPPEHSRSLMRRNTSPPRRLSSSSFDEHLAYGPLPPPLPIRRTENEVEIRGQMSKLTQLLDEANCLQYSATAMIEHLQKNPDALAAVALTLAEVSGMASRLAPSALTGLRAAFPAATALLLSPQFLIAAGVGVGVTVVMLGGYKIVKRIREGKDLEGGDDTTQLREIEGDLSRIDAWRRGIADVEAESVGTTVEGEFITPHAANQLVQERIISPTDIARRYSAGDLHGKSKSGRSEHMERRHSTRSEAESRHSHHHHHHSSSKSRRGDGDRSSRTGSGKESKRKRAVSGLKMLLQGRVPSVS